METPANFLNCNLIEHWWYQLQRAVPVRVTDTMMLAKLGRHLTAVRPDNGEEEVARLLRPTVVTTTEASYLSNK